MKVIVVDTYEEGAKVGADIIEEIVRKNPEACLGLATGSSPIGMYQELARRCREEGLDFSKVHSVTWTSMWGWKARMISLTVIS